MNNKILIGFSLCMAFADVSCIKTGSVSGTSSFTIIDAVIGSNSMVINFSGTDSLTYYATANQIYYGSYSPQSNEFSAYTGTVHLGLFEYPDTLVHGGGGPVFNLTLDLLPYSIHSLFLTGTESSPDTLFTTDNPPYYPNSDSVTGLRFINVSPSSAPVSIDIQGASGAPVLGTLSYKAVTNFMQFPANSVAQSNGYTFEVRDATSDSLLTTCSITAVLSKNQTLLFYGAPSIGYGAMTVNNY